MDETEKRWSDYDKKLEAESKSPECIEQVNDADADIMRRFLFEPRAEVDESKTLPNGRKLCKTWIVIYDRLKQKYLEQTFKNGHTGYARFRDSWQAMKFLRSKATGSEEKGE